MEQWLNQLMSNPTTFLIVGVLVILIVFFLIKKLLKLAVILFIIFIIIGIINYKTFKPNEIMEEMKKDAQELKSEAGKIAKKNIDKYKDKIVKDVKEKVKSPLSE